MIRNEIERTRQEAGGLVAMLFVACVIFGGLVVSGCAGIEAGVFMRRHDTITDNKTTVDKPLKCFFTDCGGK